LKSSNARNLQHYLYGIKVMLRTFHVILGAMMAARLGELPMGVLHGAKIFQRSVERRETRDAQA
jgi:hypothetical protein